MSELKIEKQFKTVTFRCDQCVVSNSEYFCVCEIPEHWSNSDEQPPTDCLYGQDEAIWEEIG